MTLHQAARGSRQTATEPALATGPGPHRPVSSGDLLNGAKSVEISHNGIIYRLQATRLGKLILTK